MSMKIMIGLIGVFLYTMNVYGGVLGNKEILTCGYSESVSRNNLLQNINFLQLKESLFPKIDPDVVANGCSVDYVIDREGRISGKTNSRDLYKESYYKDFKIFDDDGFICQVMVFNKLYTAKQEGANTSDEDLEILLMATDRAIKYSSDVKVVNNPNLKPDGKINLEHVLFFNTAFKDHLLRMKSNKKSMSKTVFKLWAHYIEGQRYEHFYKMEGFTREPTRGIINGAGGFPKSVPECCKFKIAELNNIIAMSLFNTNFITGEQVTKVYSENTTKCEGGYDVTYRLAKD